MPGQPPNGTTRTYIRSDVHKDLKLLATAKSVPMHQLLSELVDQQLQKNHLLKALKLAATQHD